MTGAKIRNRQIETFSETLESLKLVCQNTEDANFKLINKCLLNRQQKSERLFLANQVMTLYRLATTSRHEENWEYMQRRNDISFCTFTH